MLFGLIWELIVLGTQEEVGKVTPKGSKRYETHELILHNIFLSHLESNSCCSDLSLPCFSGTLGKTQPGNWLWKDLYSVLPNGTFHSYWSSVIYLVWFFYVFEFRLFWILFFLELYFCLFQKLHEPFSFSLLLVPACHAAGAAGKSIPSPCWRIIIRIKA